VSVVLNGAASDDGEPNPPGKLTVSWSQVSGPGQVWFSALDQPSTTAFLPGVGTYVLRLTGDDSTLKGSDDVSITIQHSAPVTASTLVAQGAVWRFLDEGSDLGSAWSAPGFNDTAWGSGAAPLGYGDANGQLPATTVSYGPDPNNKYITTIFVAAFQFPPRHL
jgi:hypothetical protein